MNTPAQVTYITTTVVDPETDNLFEAVVPRLPGCNFCEATAQYDAVMKNGGGWAYYCEDHFTTESLRALGTGIGQRLILAD